MEYPQAALVLLEHLEIGGRLTIDLSELREAAEITETEIDRYLVDARRGRRRRRGLEQQYDSFREAEAAGTSLLAGDEPLPTGEEIGRAVRGSSSPASTTGPRTTATTGGWDGR